MSQKWNHYCTMLNCVIYTAPRHAHSATRVVCGYDSYGMYVWQVHATRTVTDAARASWGVRKPRLSKHFRAWVYWLPQMWNLQLPRQLTSSFFINLSSQDF